MNYLRAILSGVILWTLIFLSFTIMSFIPVLKDDVNIQNGIILLLIIPFVILSLRFFYKNKSKVNGLYVGLIIILCSLSLDAMITVPFVIIPKGGSYAGFYTDPGLIVMGAEILLISYLCWKRKIKR